MPRSYKIWQRYLKERRTEAGKNCIGDTAYELANAAYDRCLIFLNKMPRIWIEYCEFLASQEYITLTRRTLDKALRCLPITQHARIWEVYVKFLQKEGNYLLNDKKTQTKHKKQK